MKERPIIFSSAMVRALLLGSKTMTRRVINPQPTFVSGGWHWTHKSYDNGDGARYFHTDEECAKRLLIKAGIAPKDGEKRWVKETFARIHPGLLQKLDPDPDSPQWGVLYRADGVTAEYLADYGVPWKPSIFMPRWASRITLEITSVRVERLQDITEEDAIAEGMEKGNNAANSISLRYGAANCRTWAQSGFAQLWDSIQLQRAVPKGAFAWSQNPWVYAISFKRLNFK